MRDPVLARDMFRSPKNSDEPQGIAAISKEESDYERRKRQAAELLAAAKERQNPENYKTLSEQSRPGVFRPVATGQPQAPQPNTQQQMAQMQAMGFRPVGMADGGYVKHFREGGLNTSGPVSYTLPEVISNWWTGDWGDGSVPPSEDPTMEKVTLPGPRGPSSFFRPRTQPVESEPTSPFPSGRADDVERGIKTLPQEKPTEPEKKPRDEETGGGGEKPDLTLDDIKARRSENIALAMIQAGLAMAGGQSSNPLTNIAAGGISGLQAYGQAEKERRADLAEERKYREDRAARIQRAAELRQEKELTRSTRIYDITSDRLGAIDRDISKLQTALSQALDPAQQATIQADINALKQEKESVARTGNSRLRALGIPDDVFSVAPTPVTPAIGVGSIIYQNGKAYRVTKYENGKPTAAEPID